MSNAVLDATLLVPIGVPHSGKTELANQLWEVGLLDRPGIISDDDVRRSLTGSAEDTSRDSEVLQSCDELIAMRIWQNERTYLDFSFVNEAGLRDLISLVAKHASDVCLVVMDTGLHTILKRHADAPRYGLTEDEIIRLNEVVARLSPASLGLPFIMSTILSMQVEGRDDW